MKKPHLIHGRQRVTTDATLRDDLVQSVAEADTRAAKVAFTELRGEVKALSDQVEQLTAIVSELAGATTDAVRELSRHEHQLATQIHQMLALVYRAAEAAFEREERARADDPAPSTEERAGEAESPAPFHGRKLQ